ncbi:MAG: TolC family protein [Bacteroidetes bacterium]|nr:TolC family protein [Bacteroidota bacterium]
MQFKQLISIILFVFLTGSSLNAQQNWSLNKCISYAIENNINLKEYDILNKLSLENLNQSKRNLLPGISGSTYASLNYGRSVDPNTNDIVNTQFFNNSYGISSSISIFNGFNLQNQIKYQKFRKQISEFNRLNAIDDLAFAVMTYYFDVIFYEGLLEIAMEQVEATRLNLKTVERKVEVGIKAKSDLLEMRANFEKEELNKIKIENFVETKTLQLKQLMNFVSPEKMELTWENTSVFYEQVENPQTLFDQFTQWSPFYKSFESNLKATEKNLSLSRSQLYPSLSASGSVNTGYYQTNVDEAGETIQFGNQFKNNRSQYLGASLRIPIFAKWNNRSSVKKAKLEIERAKAVLDDQKQKLFFGMVNDLTNLEALYKEHMQYEKQVEADKLAFRAAERKFEEGLISVVDFYIAKNRLANTESQVLRSQTLWEIKMKTVEFYRGKRFWEN